MRLFILLSLFISLQAFGQQLTLEEWDRQAATNIRLLPKYGLVTKTAEQKEADESLIADMLSKGLTRQEASKQFIEVGFKYLYKDLKTAMYRFNQAYLLDSTNTDIYWGYGGIYMVLGDLNRAREQYQIGLKKNPNHSKIITDLATCSMIDFFNLSSTNPEKSNVELDKAINLFSQSYKIDPKNQNTLFKMSVCYYNKKDCEKALLYYNECMTLGGDPVTEDYKEAIKTACGKK
ncbi:MAG: hypothetical protein JWM14_864 [Chitinophagaceae bacterium]|nr:hypothetical protein [Chitinophagaceae bacterium]